MFFLEINNNESFENDNVKNKKTNPYGIK